MMQVHTCELGENVNNLLSAASVHTCEPDNKGNNPVMEDSKEAITKAQLRLFNGAMAIQQEEARDAKAIKFMARSMVLATLPHSDPGDIPAWGRKNGGYSLVIQPGYSIDDQGSAKSIGIPFGVVPRLLLCWLTTEAVKTREREIVLGSSLSDFMRKIDMLPTGGQKGSITRLKNQSIKLFSSSISCVYNGENEFARVSLPVTDKTYLWWDPKNPDQVSLWKSAIVLGKEFFDEIITRPVPVDFRALKALKGSPLLLDIYTWLTYRVSYLGKPTVIPWESLAAQFGSNYARIEDFKANMKRCLKKVLIVYSDANVEPTKTGLLLKPSRTSVSIGVKF